MPTPIMPKWTRSLAEDGRGEAKSGRGFSSVVFVARDAPAAAAPISRNLRRENLLIVMVPRFLGFLPVASLISCSQLLWKTRCRCLAWLLPLFRAAIPTRLRRCKSIDETNHSPPRRAQPDAPP